VNKQIKIGSKYYSKNFAYYRSIAQTTNIHIVMGQTHAAHLHRQDLNNSRFSSIDQQNNTKPLSFFKTEHSMFL